MKIIQTFILLIFFIGYSCDRTTIADTNKNGHERKEDSISRAHFLAHSDSIQKMYISIKIPHIWNEVKVTKSKTTIIKRNDTLYPHQEIYIDISTAPQVDLLQNIEGEYKVYNIKSVTDQGDSIIFNTVKNMTSENRLWIFKYINPKKTIATWSIYNPDKKTLEVAGKYISVKGQYE